jgi:manganese efflux pump family protein
VADALKLVAIVLPLGLDTFGVALALGIAGLPAGRRTSVALLFAAFETLMPLLGVALGAPLGHAIGTAADYLAAALVIALGAYMLATRDEDDEGERMLAMTERGIYGALALGIGISLDELAIGFGAGLLRLPLLPIVIAVGLQAFLVTQLGIRLGARLGERWRESAEGVAGLALIALGVVLLAVNLAGRG